MPIDDSTVSGQITGAKSPEQAHPLMLLKERQTSGRLETQGHYPLDIFPSGVFAKVIDCADKLTLAYAAHHPQIEANNTQHFIAHHAACVFTLLQFMKKSLWDSQSIAVTTTGDNPASAGHSYLIHLPNKFVLDCFYQGKSGATLYLGPSDKHPTCTAQLTSVTLPFSVVAIDALQKASERGATYGHPSFIFPGLDSEHSRLQQDQLCGLLEVLRSCPFAPVFYSVSAKRRPERVAINEAFERSKLEAEANADLWVLIKETPYALVTPNWCGGSLMNLACESGNQTLAGILLHEIANGLTRRNPLTQEIVTSNGMLNWPNADGMTPVHLALRHGHLELALWLVSQGARVDLANRYGRLPPNIISTAK